ncbi:GGDEF domain-containing protein [Pleomorphomonas sp. PLEO]|uniref:GGDEF domain-containing protein n=1 Tax=Pleomorphomonas sp. PLEO TaxID=3239306 RepID=UPI00351E2ACA
MAADSALQLIAFGGWLDILRSWVITTGVIALVAYPVGVYLGTTRLEHYRTKTKLIEQSLADSLTGLRNRASLPIDYDAGPESDRLIILLSLDRFKVVNERHGHVIGDRVLIRSARLIAEELANLGNIYRTDGTEFTVLATGHTVADAKAQVLALLARFESTNFGTLEKPVCLTASAGIADVPSATTFTMAFAAVDAALETAKATGRSRVCLASEPATPGIVEGDEVIWSSDLSPHHGRASHP